ncbi:conserved Plasmodium protein, unknown function [Plasmodium relictum]|uniref:Uncharacterized protein n=1 Tax=Plasmodium relictum TaxID=85471 RepID=A0A1J1HF21_PLARL|nr:conserved Plasmodium protein, unknown function [Plasmodium relictum]CRH04000.1 conserved Plasmodium protein, unknown function [Plasmodium relictum]
MSNNFLEVFNEVNPHVDIYSYETRKLTNKPLFLIKNERKFLFLAREPCEYKLDHLYMDNLEVAENIKRKLINEQIHIVLVLYFKILKELMMYDKYRRGIDEKLKKVIASAIKLYSLKERHNKNIRKSYIKKIYSIYNNLSKILIQYKNSSGNILKSKSSLCNFDYKRKKLLSDSNDLRKDFSKCATNNIKLNEKCKCVEEWIKEENIKEAINVEKERESSFKNKLYYNSSNSSELLNNYRKLYNPPEKLKKLYLKKDFTIKNCLRCLYSAQELNNISKNNYQKKVKLFKCFKTDCEYITLSKRNELLNKFKGVLEKKKKILNGKKKKNNSEIQKESIHKRSSDDTIIILSEKSSPEYSEDNAFLDIRKNTSNELKSILLNTNNTYTTFKLSNDGNIQAIIQLSENNKRKKKFIALNEYDYFFNSNTDELKEGISKKNKDTYNYEKFFFYVDKRKIIFDKKKKEKIIFEMNPNGLLKKYVFRKDKKNNDILMKIYSESEWSDNTVDFCYITKNKNKEKIVIKKSKNGSKHRIIYKESELNGREEFDYYKRNIENIKEINFYDDDDAILHFLKKNEKKRTKMKNKHILKKKKDSEDTITFHRKEKNDVYLKKKNESSIDKNINEINEKNQLDLLLKLKKRKDRFLKGVCIFNKEETYSIKKIPKLKNIKTEFKIHNNNTSMEEKKKFNKLGNIYEINEKEKDENKETLNEKNIITDEIKKKLKKNNLPSNKKVLDNKEKIKYIYDNLKKKDSKKSSMYSINKLTSIFAKKNSSKSFEKYQQNTSKKIEDFVFNENLKSLSATSYSLSGIVLEQSPKILLYEKSLNLSSKSFKSKDNGIISELSSFSLKKENFDVSEDVFSKKTSYSIIKSSSIKDDNNISKKTSCSLTNNFKDEKCIVQTESNGLSKKGSSFELSELSSYLELNVKPDDKKSANTDENKSNNLKEKSEQIDEDNDNEKKERIRYLSQGFSAHAHIILSETNIISRKCIISYNFRSEKLKMMRNEKIFEIDRKKLNIQEIPTYDKEKAIVKLVTSKKNYNALLIESGDLVGLQYLGDEIGWIYEEKNDSLKNKLKGDVNEPKDVFYKLNSNNPKKRISFFEKIKLNKFLGR